MTDTKITELQSDLFEEELNDADLSTVVGGGLLDPVEGLVKGLPLLGGLLHPVIGTLNGVTDKLPVGGLTSGLSS